MDAFIYSDCSIIRCLLMRPLSILQDALHDVRWTVAGFVLYHLPTALVFVVSVKGKASYRKMILTGYLLELNFHSTVFEFVVVNCFLDLHLPYFVFCSSNSISLNHVISFHWICCWTHFSTSFQVTQALLGCLHPDNILLLHGFVRWGPLRQTYLPIISLPFFIIC